MIKFKTRMGTRGRVTWRELAVSEQSTLHDLALSILESYEDVADDDFHPDDLTHLYGFWMTKKPWEADAVIYWHPEADHYPQANWVKLGDLNLTEGQRFFFLFDFGANWLFQIRVVSKEG